MPPSATAVVERLAEVEVVTDPAAIARAESWGSDVEEVDLDAAELPTPLDEMRATRDAQRGQPGFGALAGRSPVYVRRRADDLAKPGVVYWELDRNGRRMREVEAYDDGTSARYSNDDWVINMPFVDMYHPRAAVWEISGDVFEEVWRRAVPGHLD
jgi:hypothetical protein